MPGISGLEATRLCRESGIVTPVIILSSEAEMDVEAAKKEGADWVLEKPASFNTLKENLEKIGISVPAHFDRRSQSPVELF